MNPTSNHHKASSKLDVNANMHLLKTSAHEDEDDSESSDNSDSNNNDINDVNNMSRITGISNMNTLNSINAIESNKLYTMPPQSLGRTESIDSVSNTAKRSARVRHQDEITTTTRSGIGSVDPEDNDGDPSERKRRRNTEAARRSRLKKMQKIETLDASVMILQRDRKDLEVKVAVLENEKLTLLARQKDLMDRVSTLEQHLHEAHQAMLKMNSMKAHSASETEKESAASAAGRILRCRVGPSLSTLETAAVNADTDPILIDSPFFVGSIAVRVKNFSGIAPIGTEPIKNTAYFGTRRRLFSIQVQGRFKHEHSADDVMFGAEFQHKVNPPTGAWLAMKFANVIDPALLADLYSNTPWLYSPMLCSMNIANVVKAAKPTATLPIPNTAVIDQLKPSQPKPLYKLESGSETSMALSKALAPGNGIGFDVKEVLGDWVWGGEKELHENNALLLPEYLDEPKFPADGVHERRKYYGHKRNREQSIFSPDYVYNMEIFAPFIDLNTFDLNLGINVNLVRYLNNQPIRLVCKSLSKNIPFFIVEFDLLKLTDLPEQCGCEEM
ncbi:hypothetical protein HDU78_004196 [Chytriomyces hyalinus]|nr:hypothetical protein HDU78_004196 [Chytriomyces hyalinus]